ncbi:MAG: hypothetical protein FWG50_11960 [Kiritimatiellaeota bacterium]|nr:hypothetical protein [Kiritimatiellota bacterium]
MKKMMIMTAVLCSLHTSVFADTNALIEVKLFKDWVIKGECDFGNLAIKNTGTDSIHLAKDPVYFEIGQLKARPLPRDPYADRAQEEHYKVIRWDGEFFNLLPEETHVYEGRKFHLGDYNQYIFSEEMRFTVSVYLGKGFWLDSEPLTVNGVVPDSEEHLGTIDSDMWKLITVTYQNERWLYKTIPSRPIREGKDLCFPICPLSLTNKIRIEPYDNKVLFKIWDGDKTMIYDMYKSILIEGPDENNVLGKWTRERKQKAEADNAEVRRKKAEEEK